MQEPLNNAHLKLTLETANQVARDIISSRSGEQALRHILHAAKRLANARYAAIGVLGFDGKTLDSFLSVGLTREEEAKIGDRPKGLGILRLLLERDTPLRISDITSHQDRSGFPEHHPEMHSFLGIPIRHDNATLGSIYLTEREGGGDFTIEDEMAVEALAAYAAVAIHNLRTLQREKALVKGLINAQEEERRAVAYDLHDGLTQFVMAAHAHLDSARRARNKGNIERADREEELGLRYLKEATLESRRLVNGLRSLTLDDLGLAGALEQIIAEEKDRAGWSSAEFHHNIPAKRFDKALETTVFRVAQEALTNARKHANTDKVHVSLVEANLPQFGSEHLHLMVSDWGQGFHPEQKIGDYTRVGLQGMFERVRLMGGVYELHSAPGEGTTLSAIFPLVLNISPMGL